MYDLASPATANRRGYNIEYRYPGDKAWRVRQQFAAEQLASNRFQELVTTEGLVYEFRLVCVVARVQALHVPEASIIPEGFDDQLTSFGHPRPCSCADCEN